MIDGHVIRGESATAEWQLPINPGRMARVLAWLVQAANDAASPAAPVAYVKHAAGVVWSRKLPDIAANDAGEYYISFSGGAEASWLSGSETRATVIGPESPWWDDNDLTTLRLEFPEGRIVGQVVWLETKRVPRIGDRTKRPD